MGNISSNINLSAFKDAVVIKHGKNKDIECLLIPLERNGLKNGQYGVQFETVGFPLKAKKDNSKSTHIIKQSFSKEVTDKFTEEERMAQPIFGNHVNWDEHSGGGSVGSVAAPQIEEDDDLPF